MPDVKNVSVKYQMVKMSVLRMTDGKNVIGKNARW